MNKEQIEAAFKNWKGYPLPDKNADGQYPNDYLHREYVAFLAGAVFFPDQLEKAPEPAGFQIRNSYSKNEWTGCHGFATTEEAEQCGSEWRYVYTSPPEVAELQKQVQVLQATIRKIADQKPRLMQDQDGHEVVCYSPAFNPCKIARDAIAAAPPFTSLLNPDLAVIEIALDNAKNQCLQIAHSFNDHVPTIRSISDAIAALKRNKGK